jgi:DhnA family fructose-bisphosphate aldolase class Ia
VSIPSAPAGLARRMGRLFGGEGGISIVVAMDHGIVGVPAGFADARALIASIVAARPDGILLNAGQARRTADLLARRDSPALVLALDHVLHRENRGGGPSVTHVPQIAIEEAVRLGADAVKTMLNMGQPDRRAFAENVSALARFAEDCRRWEMPLMIEPYLWGEAVPADPVARAEMNADGARIAVELGADILKVEVGADPERFRTLVAASPVPVVVLGGPKRATQRETLADIVAAAEAGAVGLTIGRNVWQHPDPVKMTRALSIAMRARDLDAALAALA